MNTPKTPTAEPLAPLTGSALRVETWECRACGQHVPCVVSLTYELTGYQEIDEGDHYRRQSCLAREPKATDWKRMPNVPSSAAAPGGKDADVR